jgi:general secretion pathway protein L
MASSPEHFAGRATPAWRQKASHFWRWWAGEISGLLPERLSLLRGGAGTPLIAVEGDELTLVDPQAAASGGERKISVGALDEPRRKSALRAFLERAGETRGRARVALGRDEALVRRVTLPAATEENLEQVLAFEMDRLSPFRAEEVYFDYRVVSRDPASGQITVELALARRALVDARVQQLRSMGASVQGVSLRDGGARAPLDLLPSEQRGARESSREALVRLALIWAVLLLLFAALVVPLYRKREEVLALHPQVSKAKQEAESTDAIVRELEKQVGDYNFLLARKHGTYPAAAYVEEISRLLPDNTWLQQLDVKTAGKTREVQVTGETPSSSKLIELFEQSKVLQNAAPRGTVTRGAGPGTERFMIAAEVRPRPQPEPQPLSAGTVPPPPPPRPAPAAPAQPATAAEPDAPEPDAAPAPAKATPSRAPPRPAPQTRPRPQ